MAFRDLHFISAIAVLVCLMPEACADDSVATLTLVHKRTKVFPTEEVILKCEISPPSIDKWSYEWLSEGQVIDTSNDDTYSTKSPKTGAYACVGIEESGNRTAPSADISIEVYDPPKPSLQLVSRWSKVFPTETVTLKCDIQPASPDWSYKWYKGEQEISGENTDTLSMKSVVTDHAGVYKCQGVHVRGVETPVSDAVKIDVYGESPETVLSMTPQADVIYTKESVQLTCQVKQESTDWQYVWLKDQQVVDWISGATHNIPSVSPGNSGGYQCRVERGGLTSQISSVNLNVEDPPKPTLQLVSRWSKVFPTETVTLKCDIQPASPDWSYKWYKGEQEISGENTDTLSMKSVVTDHAGVYKCQGVHVRGVETPVSDAVKIDVYGQRPETVLSMTPQADVIYTKESVQLTCQVKQESTDWQYVWLKDQQVVDRISGATHNILSVSPGNSGGYQCRVERGGLTSQSISVNLNVEDPPKPTLQLVSRWSKVFPTETVTLKCDIQPASPDWSYKWYRGGQEISENTDTLSMKSVGTGDTGEYTCQGVHTRGEETPKSDRVKIDVYGQSPEPVLSMTPQADVIYTKESVQLTCQVKQESTDWQYVWLKDDKQEVHRSSEANYKIPSVSPGNSGGYRCRVEREGLTSQSSSVNLNVEDPPKPTLQLVSRWSKVFPTETVTLKCDIQPASPDWSYKWYRGGQEISGENTDTLSMTSVDTGNAGQYTCQGVHVRQAETSKSDPIGIRVYDRGPKPILSKDPKADTIYTTEKVTLSCRVDQESTDWHYSWFKGQEKLSIRNISESTHTFPSVDLSDGGDYRCQVQRGHISGDNASITLTVQDPPLPTLELKSKYEKVFPTERVTLKCDIQPTSSDWSYKWYRGEQEISGENTDTLSMTSVGTGDTGEYTCQGVHKRHVETPISGNFSVHVYDEKAQPTITQHPNSQSIYMEEKVTFSCEVTIDPTDWSFLWFSSSRGEIKDPRSMNYTIQSATEQHNDKFWCKAERPGYLSEASTSMEVKILPRHDTVLTLETNWADILTVDSLTLLCEVSDNKEFQWNYTWYKDDIEDNNTQSALHVKATKESYKSEYRCCGAREERPTYSARSEPFIANNIVLKRQILLAISGCLVVGIVLVIAGCVYFKVTRKPGKEAPTQEDLFFSMAQLKSRNDLHSTTDLCQTEINGKPTEKDESEDPPCLSEELLKEAKEEEKNEDETDAFKSFKG
ncbi:sialoadhesin-like [Engraulis encrasicolus]|uniref:sialoadhesin-like n=1 Tax=Engraulis encrasicolus TaxID=184585 RepID=UPI002FD4FB22